MSRAGLNPSAAMTRGITETQAAMVNSRWFRHSVAGARLAAAFLAWAARGPGSQEISGGQSCQLRGRGGVPSPSVPRRWLVPRPVNDFPPPGIRSEEHTSELQSLRHLV